MTDVGHQTVRNVDGRVGQAAQCLSECNTRQGVLQCSKAGGLQRLGQQGLAEQVRQPQGGSAGLPGNPEVIAALGGSTAAAG